MIHFLASLCLLFASISPIFADIMRETRSMRVRFSGESHVVLIRYSSYCTLNSELYGLYGGELNVISMAVDQKASMIGDLQNEGQCRFPNGMYLVNGVGYRFFQKSFACKALLGEVAHQEKTWPGSYRVVSNAALGERLDTGDCSYDDSVTFCKKIIAQKAWNPGILTCANDDDVSVYLRNPDTGEIVVYSMTASEVKQYEYFAKSVQDINDEITSLEISRAGCDSMSGKNMCGTFALLAFSPDRYSKLVGATGTIACFWVTGACVRLIDVKLKDLDKEKEKAQKAQDEREAQAKANGTVPNPGSASGASTGENPGPIGPAPSYPDPFPPVYDGEVIITEPAPGPMPGTGGGKSHL